VTVRATSPKKPKRSKKPKEYRDRYCSRRFLGFFVSFGFLESG
jgi:hypothetical protein